MDGPSDSLVVQVGEVGGQVAGSVSHGLEIGAIAVLIRLAAKPQGSHGVAPPCSANICRDLPNPGFITLADAQPRYCHVGSRYCSHRHELCRSCCSYDA